MAEPPILWQPNPGFQVEFAASSAFECLGGGAAGPGKTDVLLVDGLRYIDQPWCKVLFLRRSFPELREVMDRAHRLFPALGGVWSASEKRWTFPAGSIYEFGYASTYAELTQYDGREFTEVRWDELGHVPEVRMWLYLQTRVRSPHPEAVLRVRASAMPGGVGNAWIRKRFIDPCGVDGGSYTDPKTGRTIAYVPGKLSENPYLDGPGRTAYRQNLEAQPEALRRALLYGEWESAEGLALSELGPEHLITPKVVPPYWTRWGGFDWGFSHWAVFCDLAQDERGTIYVVDSVWMRRLHPDQQAETIWERVPVTNLSVVYAGPDCWAVHQARSGKGVIGPTIADTFAGLQIPLAQADTGRKQGLDHLRNLVSYRGRGPEKSDAAPKLLFFDTPGNKKLIDQLSGLILDPDNPEDVLKVNADPTTGDGGDDGYDALRYGLLSYRANASLPLKQVDAFAPEVLAQEFEKQRRGKAGGKMPSRERDMVEGLV